MATVVPVHFCSSRLVQPYKTSSSIDCTASCPSLLTQVSTPVSLLLCLHVRVVPRFYELFQLNYNWLISCTCVFLFGLGKRVIHSRHFKRV